MKVHIFVCERDRQGGKARGSIRSLTMSSVQLLDNSAGLQGLLRITAQCNKVDAVGVFKDEECEGFHSEQNWTALFISGTQRLTGFEEHSSQA